MIKSPSVQSPIHEAPESRQRHRLAALLALTVLGSLGMSTGCGGTSTSAAPAPAQPPVVSANPAPGGSLSYASIAATAGQAIAPAAPTLTNASAASYSVSPALPAGLTLDPATGVITGTPTTPSAQVSCVVSATTDTGRLSAPVAITVAAAGGVPGFTALFQFFPGTASYASSRTTAAMAANPWMKGARFGVVHEGICQDTTLPLSTWNSDVANVTGYASPLSTTIIRMNADPSGSWNIQGSAAVTNMDAVVAGEVAVAKAAGTASFLIDLENYATSFFFCDYNQTADGNPILNSPALSRPAMCAQMRTFGKAYGTSLWSRLPNATLYTFFGPTVLLPFINGTGIPTSFPDSSYATDPRYNMLPYFFLGLLDACPATGHIADYCERSYYDFTGLASIKRNMTASKNWVSIFFPGETADIAKAATCWVPLPLIFANPYFDASYGSIYPEAYYVTNAADRLAYFTRNATYCLQQTPAGFMPGVYVEDYDPWGNYGAATNMPAAWETGLANALAVYRGTTTLDNLFNVPALDTLLANVLSRNSAWAAESK